MGDAGWRLVFSGLLIAIGGCGVGAGTAHLRGRAGRAAAGIVVTLGFATAFVGAMILIWTVGR